MQAQQRKHLLTSHTTPPLSVGLLRTRCGLRCQAVPDCADRAVFAAGGYPARVLLADVPAVPWQDTLSSFSTLAGAIGSSIAALVAVVLAGRESKARKTAEVERDEARRQAIQQAARHVFGWVEIRYNEAAENPDDPGAWSLHIVVANYSSEPMVQLRWHAGSVEEGGDWFSPCAAGEIRILPPGEVRRVDLMKDNEEAAQRLIQGRGHWPFLIMSYEDASGNEWLRDRNGELLPDTAENGEKVCDDSYIVAGKPKSYASSALRSLRKGFIPEELAEQPTAPPSPRRRFRWPRHPWRPK